MVRDLAQEHRGPRHGCRIRQDVAALLGVQLASGDHAYGFCNPTTTTTQHVSVKIQDLIHSPTHHLNPSFRCLVYDSQSRLPRPDAYLISSRRPRATKTTSTYCWLVFMIVHVLLTPMPFILGHLDLFLASASHTCAVVPTLNFLPFILSNDVSYLLPYPSCRSL